jgi:DNA-binding response OmpR family regulator
MPPKQIVLIEDDPDIQKMVRMALKFTADSDVTVAGDGRTGVATVRSVQPGCVLLDVMLPDMDGYAVIRLLREDPATRSVPVIFLSARAQAPEVAEGIGLGAAGYLVKPFDPMRLAAEIDRILADGG